MCCLWFSAGCLFGCVNRLFGMLDLLLVSLRMLVSALVIVFMFGCVLCLCFEWWGGWPGRFGCGAVVVGVGWCFRCCLVLAAV